MLTDTKIKVCIKDYAQTHGIYVPELFGQLFDLSATATFRRGEQIRLPIYNMLCLIYSGAVLGKLRMHTGAYEHHLLFDRELFYTGLNLDPTRKLLDAKWTAVLPTELTCISLTQIEPLSQNYQSYWEDLINHIIACQEQQRKLFHTIQNESKLVNKIAVMLEHSKSFLDIKQIHLAEYLKVTAPSYSRSLKEWERKNLP